MINKFLALLAILSVYFAGNVSGRYSANTNWQTKVAQQRAEYNQKYSDQLANNALISESYQQVKAQLNQTMGDRQRAIQENKELIDTNNRITRDFVRYFKSAESRGELQKDDKSAIIDPDGIIPATDFLIWSVGLQTHDNQCVNQLNNLIKQIN